MHTLSSLWLRFYQSSAHRLAIIIMAIVVFGGLGVYMLSSGHAKTPVVAVEAESGVVTSTASIKTDATASGGAAVVFGTIPYSTKTGELSVYLSNSSSQVMCLDDEGNLTADGSIVVINPCSTTSAEQQWSLYSNNTIRINGKCLAAQNNGTNIGTPLVISTCTGASNQVWAVGTNPLLSLNDLVSPASGNCMDVYESYTAANSEVDLWTCNGTAAQVWGWNTNGTVVLGGDTAGANCYGTVTSGFGAACYNWVGAYQNNNDNFNASGVSADFTQAAPAIESFDNYFDNHSIIELYAASNDGKEGVEIGWYAGDYSGGPTLFATDWVNGAFIGYAENGGTGFVPVSTTMHVGDPVATGTTGNYKILFASNQWQIWYNNAEIGYFPESVWTSRGVNFTSVQWVSPYGEICDQNGVVASSQMGNGILGSSNGAASVTNYTLYNSSTPADLVNYYEPQRHRYRSLGLWQYNGD